MEENRSGMNRRHLALARAVMQNLLAHPCSCPVREDLSKLPTRYQSYGRWVSDVREAVAPQPHFSLQQIAMGNAMDDLFSRELRHMHFYPDLQTWSTEVSRVRNRLGELIYSPPRYLLSAFSGFDMQRPIRPQLPNDADYEQFLEATQKMTNLEDQEALMKLIETEQPELGSAEPKVLVNVLALKPGTFVKARELVRQRLRQQHIEYPSGFY
jgi:hypothetical protein